jgi:hypothetical protein
LRRGGSPRGEEGHPPSRSLPRRRGVLSDVAGSSAPLLFPLLFWSASLPVLR